jgi:hypothetical protein
MRTGFSWLLGACIFAAAPAFAQTPLALPDLDKIPSPTGTPKDGKPEAPPTIVTTDGPRTEVFELDGARQPFTVWGRAEYLLYFVKNTPMPVSLLTGPDPTNPTQELLSGDRGFGPFSGMRFTVGAWVDQAQTRGFEGSFFSLQRRSSTFSASSDGAGTPTLQFPFVNLSPGAVGNFLMPIAYPGIFAGSVNVTSTLQLWGAELNGLRVFIPRETGVELVGLLGVRYLNLQESLDISTVSSALLTNPQTILAQSDAFNTRNQFYGGQLGARLTVERERFGFDITGKIALGATQQSIDINGVSAQSGPGGPNGVFPGGFFAQPSNMGHYTSSSFSVVPEIQLKLRYAVTPRFVTFVGYDFLYWNNVVRPGAQVNSNINLTQSQVLGNGALIGPAAPVASINRSDFWAQGVTFGCELRY